MDRRSFLKKLGISAATMAVAPIAVEVAAKLMPSSCDCALRSFWDGPCDYHVQMYMRQSKKGRIGEYADYMNFSDYAVCQEIDETVAKAADELGKAFGERIANLYAAAC